MNTLPAPADYLQSLLQHRKQEYLDLIRRHSRPLMPLPTGVRADGIIGPEVKAVFFDVYGTLLVSSRGEVGSGAPAGPAGREGKPPDAAEGPFAAALREAGYDPRLGAEERAEELYRRLIDESHAADRALGIAHPEVDILSIWERMLRRLSAEGLLDRGPEPNGVVTAALGYELRSNMVWPMPGAREVLEGLQRRGIHLGIVSNAQFYTPLMLEALFGASLQELGFSEEVWSYCESEAKPSSHLFTLLFERLTGRGVKLEPQESVYVGNDMLNDIHAASSAGLRTVLFAGDGRSLRLREEEMISGAVRPDAVCTDLQQLFDIVILNPIERRGR